MPCFGRATAPQPYPVRSISELFFLNTGILEYELTRTFFLRYHGTILGRRTKGGRGFVFIAFRIM